MEDVVKALCEVFRASYDLGKSSTYEDSPDSDAAKSSYPGLYRGGTRRYRSRLQNESPERPGNCRTHRGRYQHGEDTPGESDESGCYSGDAEDGRCQQG